MKSLAAWLGRLAAGSPLPAASRGVGRAGALAGEAARFGSGSGEVDRSGHASGHADRSGRASGEADRSRSASGEALWLEWLALAGVLGFATWLLGLHGVWSLLLQSDPTGISLVIIVVFAGSTGWCGARTRELERQQRRWRDAGATGDGWGAEYLAALARPHADAAAALDVLLECTHGPHATAWWVNGIQLKLGLLGKVIGFSILALTIGRTPSFDAAQSQELLRSLTAGLGVALLTTMVGLVGNILLGLQLTRLDRFADALVTEWQRAGLALPRGEST